MRDAESMNRVAVFRVTATLVFCFVFLALLQQRIRNQQALDPDILLETSQADAGSATAAISWNLQAPSFSAAAPIDEAWLSDARLDRYRTTSAAKTSETGSGELPQESRWRIEFTPGVTVTAYANQLDALGVELAVFKDKETLEYASKLADSKPTTREGKRIEENRLFLTWARGDLVDADRSLMANAGIGAADKVILHFLPEDSQQTMAKLEQEYSKQPIEKIGRTIFGLRQTFRGYQLFVKRQLERS
jgi:hypothetical protein